MTLILDILLFGIDKNPSRVITPFQAGKNSSKKPNFTYESHRFTAFLV